jgi:toxin ParE1/3/4
MIQQISKEAEKDLEKIWLHTQENWSVEQADRYLDLLFEMMDIENRL